MLKKAPESASEYASRTQKEFLYIKNVRLMTVIIKYIKLQAQADGT
jgi:hypothetical protein